MMSLIRRRPSVEVVEREDPSLSLAAWAELLNAFSYSGISYTLPGSTQEEIGAQFVSAARSAYKQNGVVFACCLVRMLLFAEARMMYRRTRGGRPGDLFSFKDDDLGILRVPWPNGTTGDLLSRMIQHSDLAGNAFVARRRDKLAVLRPDWVTIIGGVDGDADATVWHPDAEILGYAFRDGGPGSGKPPMFFDVSEVAHFAPIPDPEARFRGMSWLTPIVREIMADKSMNEHKLVSFEKGATPNMIVKMDVDDLNKFKDIVTEFRAQHEGSENASKTLFLAAGADATVVGSTFQQTDFKSVQGAGETRIAAAAGVPPVIVGLSEGLDAATYSNYAQARRRLSDGTMRPLWRQAAGALATIIRVPSDGELWYDDRDIKFLQEDQKDAADIQQVNAMSIRTLVDSGFKPDSVVSAITSGDLGLLEHTSLFSVQLQPAGTTPKQGLLQGVPVKDGQTKPGDPKPAPPQEG
jgi:phage portal protein BeeE